MLRALRLTAALLAGLAVPALAQTTSTSRPTTPPAATSTRPSTAPAAAPARPTAQAAAAPTAAVKRIDINSASEQEIATLPGIGAVYSKNIVQGRPWDDLGDLVKKKALPQSVFDRNKDRFALANINTSSAADLAKTLPGIGDVRSRAIVSGRPYATPQDLVSKKVLTPAQFDKIKDLITY